MRLSFVTTIMKDGEKNATGLEVPAEIISVLNAGKKPKVVITIKNYTYRSTVAVMGGAFMIPLSQEHRAAAGLQPGENVTVTLELDTEPRTVEMPADLAEAMAQHPGTAAAFEALSYSVRKEMVRQVESAKAAETRLRRIAAVIEKLAPG
jgi:antitoxin component of MazEF toxin-antitoxin module